MSRPTISCAVIAKNESENVKKWRESLGDCFDEIIFVDTGSTDDTIQVAESLGCDVHHFQWINDFSAARNYAFSLCKSDYIFWCDLDDVLMDAEQFKLFRDNTLMLADYWMAKYDYSHDASGKPVCSFVRERIVKRSKGFKWKYFLHEGITPDSGQDKNVNIQYAKNWYIKHTRTENDLLKDRSRNLNIFKQHENKIDARMAFYYGKEWFENGSPLQAKEWLERSVVDPSLEVHDRLLAYQYLCYALIQLSNSDKSALEKAISHALCGVQLAPNRAEYYCIIGDCYIKQGRLVEAIPAFSAAMNCNDQTPAGYAPIIFNNSELYGTYPKNQLARIYANTGNIEKSLSIIKEAWETHKHPESKAILEEVERASKKTVGYKNAAKCGDIVFTCLPSPYTWDANIYKEKSMGGSETACIEMAHHIAALTHKRVIVFNHRESNLICDGVEYRKGDEMYDYFSQHEPFMHIAWRHNIKMTNAPTFVWSHDLQTQGVENTENYNRVLCLTPFHRRHMMVTQGVPESKIHVTRNGLNPSRFKDMNVDKEHNRFVFGSSPDRGLERCMRVLDKVREVYPDVTLHVHYGYEHLHKYGLGDMAKKLEAMIKERPWVTYHGATEQVKLMESYKKSQYNVQPSDWIETSCITALELLACGVYPIFRKVGGVVDTLGPYEEKGMATLVDSECLTELEYQKYADAVIMAIQEEKWKNVSIDVESHSWRNVAKEWLTQLPELK